MSKQQTAVEWLIEKMQNGDIEIEMTNCGAFISTKGNIFDTALEMEKQQIVKAFNEGTFSEMEKIDAEDYYNQTYGTKKSD